MAVFGAMASVGGGKAEPVVEVVTAVLSLSLSVSLSLSLSFFRHFLVRVSNFTICFRNCRLTLLQRLR